MLQSLEFLIFTDPKTLNSTSNLRKLVIAIDGPAASGKSTTAKLTAERLGYMHIDTGAMYRAMTLKVLEQKIDVNDAERIGNLAEETEVRLRRKRNELQVLLDNQDVTKRIRSQAVSSAVSAVSSVMKIREALVREQRSMGNNGGIVLEGRDIGTVVFPNADIKIFMIANVEERARRRQRELRQTGIEVDIEKLEKEIVERDRKDSERSLSPLRKADDAIVLDTSDMTIEQQVEFIIHKAKEILRRNEKV